MANIKISELNPLLTVEDADVLPIVDNAVTKKVTAAILRSYTQGNSVLLTGAQTIAGIKTFTSQLASTVATGTAPFSVASTTKVTNLNADLLDGLSSADFATLTGTQTLTNKTLTSPIINEVLDSNGNEILAFTPIASATDYISIKNGIGVGVPLHISATGASANIGLHLEPKGTGLVQISDGTDTTKGIRFRSSGSATAAVTLIDAVSSAGRVITLPNATGTLALTSDLTAYVPTTTTVSTTSPLAGGGALSGNLTLSIPQSSGSVNGYLSSTDWAIFNAKQNTITLTTTGTSGAATLVGSTLNIPNYADTDTGITSLNGLTALTQTFAVGTSGTDFGISSATSTHTFNLPTASAVNRGALSSADWTTFNNKQNALTNPITGTGTTNYLPKFTGASALGDSIISDSAGIATIAGRLTANGVDYHTLTVADGGAQLRLERTGSGAGLMYLGADSSGFKVFDSAFTTRFFVGNTGNVGIGTTTPSEKLDLQGTMNMNGASGTYLQVQYNGANRGYIGTANAIIPSGSTADFGFAATSNLLFGSGGSLTERMRITSSGNVGIGTTSPLLPLQISSGAGSFVMQLTNGNFVSSSTGSRLLFGFGAATGNTYADIRANSDGGLTSVPLVLQASGGNVGIGTTTPTGTYGKLSVAGGISILNDNNAKLEIGRYSSGVLNSYIKLGANSNSLRITNNTDSSDLISFENNGNVLIGTTTDAGYKLDVNGTGRFSGNVGIGGIPKIESNLTIYNTNANNELTFAGAEFTNIYSETTSGMQFGISSSGNSAAIDFLTNNTVRLKIKSTGVINIANIPTSAVGLSAGDIYSNLGVLTIV
jgi:hypothetical protein